MKDPMTLVARWLILAAAVWVAAEVVSGIRYEGLASILVVAAILGLMNLYVRPLITLLTLPITIITLGFFILLLNALLLGLAAWLSDAFGVDFSVDGLGSALLGALIISLVSLVMNHLLRPERFSSRY